MKHRSLHVALALLMLLSCEALSQAKQLAVVVGKSNKQTEITAVELQKILAFNMKQWPDGNSVKIVLRHNNAADVEQLLQKLLKIPADRAKALFESHKNSFLLVDSDESLLNYVSSVSGAIGFVDVYSITGTVTVVKVDGKLPFDPGYILHSN